jgi:hypothetical protein
MQGWIRLPGDYPALCEHLAEMYGDLATVEEGAQIAYHLADIGALRASDGHYLLLDMNDDSFYAACQIATGTTLN